MTGFLPNFIAMPVFRICYWLSLKITNFQSPDDPADFSVVFLFEHFVQYLVRFCLTKHERSPPFFFIFIQSLIHGESLDHYVVMVAHICTPYSSIFTSTVNKNSNNIITWHTSCDFIPAYDSPGFSFCFRLIIALASPFFPAYNSPGSFFSLLTILKLYSGTAASFQSDVSGHNVPIYIHFMCLIILPLPAQLTWTPSHIQCEQ